MDSFFKLLDDLIKPGNWPFLAAFILALIGMAVFIAFLITAEVKQDGFNRSWRVRSLWIHLSGGPDDPTAQKRGYRKLLYVKVNYLAEKTSETQPFYQRAVSRLEGPDQMVPVYDEAVYYTLKLLPQKRAVIEEKDKSHDGVVDWRVLIPWPRDVGAPAEVERWAKNVGDMETTRESDTMLTVSHILNGLQEQNQKFMTFADEDAESLRLVVDFSSIPNAANFVKWSSRQPRINQPPANPDDLKYEDCGGSVYMAHYRKAPRGTLLEMDFAFENWKAAAQG